MHLEDISVRDVYLPSFDVGATLIPREHGAFPGASLYFHIDKIEVHLSTDILNQLLVVQSSFVKVRACLPISCKLHISVYWMLYCFLNRSWMKQLPFWEKSDTLSLSEGRLRQRRLHLRSSLVLLSPLMY